ncbi:hypothetical protein H8I69_04995 [Serratia fonticola]|uniref:hypothetical protein n=1 Tax=Serratia fonticola TaxID=47917 RepID=UPI0015C612C6|nr:hypothetical protein [Serratia fonticola]MBC3378474.1 hypothetical protein [Serratia fonticola]NYA37674.1 hypothetical protein [Serratia fonticola]
MLAQQMIQLIFWLGVIAFTPTFYRFCYAASGLMWRHFFPTRKFEIVFKDEDTNTKRSVLIKLPKDDSKTLVKLIEEEVSRQKGRG